MPSYPLINGKRRDFASIEAVINGKRFVGIKEISYKDSLEPGDVYGAHAQRIGRTRGQYKAEASVTMYKAEFDDFLATLGDGYLEKEFNIDVMYADDDAPISIDGLVSCRIKSPDFNASGGSDALSVKLDLDVMYITRNGKKPLQKMLAGTI